MKDFILRFIMKLFLSRRNIRVSGINKIDYRLLKKKSIHGSKEYPSMIRNSQIGNIDFGIGCRFFDCVCQGKVNLGNFVTLAGPGIKVCGNVQGVEIRSFCSVGANVIIQEGQHNYKNLTTYFVNRNILHNNLQEEISSGKILINEGVWIGSNVTILSGVEIGRGAVIGAGSVVTKNMAPYSICYGVPAKVMSMRFSDDDISLIEKSEWWKMSTDEMKLNTNLFGQNFLDILRSKQTQ